MAIDRDGTSATGSGEALRAAIFWGAAAIAMFSLSLPMTRLALAAFDPWTIMVSRSLSAVPLAAGYLIYRRAPWPRLQDWARILGVVLGVVVGFPLASGYALMAMPTPRAAVIGAILPAATAVVAVLRAGEKPSRLFWLAAGLGSALTVLFAFGPGSLVSSDGDWVMLAAVVLGAFGYAEGGVVARRLGGPETICWALVTATPILLCSVVFRPLVLDVTETPTLAWIGLGYLTVFSAFLGFFAWYHALALGGVARISQMQLCGPPLTLVWASFLGEPASALSILAALLILGCVLFAQKAQVGSGSCPPKPG